MTSKEQVKPKSTSFIALGVYLLGTVASAWAEPDALFAEATRRLAQDRPVYAFTVVTRGSKEVLVETFDPSLEIDAQWQLLSVNDEAPDEDRVEIHREQKRQEREEKPPKKFRELVDLASLERVAENETEVLYEFKPNLFDDKPELNEKFVGKIVITKADLRIKQMEYRNTEKIKPAAVVTLEKLYTQVNFMTLSDGQPVAQTISIHSQGTAFVFKKFDERVTQEYSDYRRVIQEPPAEISDKDSTASPDSIVDEEPGT